jgi:hypothetical protein
VLVELGSHCFLPCKGGSGSLREFGFAVGLTGKGGSEEK